MTALNARLLNLDKNNPYDSVVCELISQGLKVQRNSDLFEAMYKSNTYGFCTVGRDHRFHELNDKVCEIWGRDRKTLQAMTYDEMTPEPFLNWDNMQVARLISGEIGTYDMCKPYYAPNMVDLILCHLDVGLIINPETQEVELFLSKILSLEDHKRIGLGFLELENKLHKLKKAGRL